MTVGTEVLRYLAYKPAAFDGKIQPFIRRLVDTSEFSTGECILYNVIYVYLKKKKQYLTKNVSSFQLSTSHT